MFRTFLSTTAVITGLFVSLGAQAAEVNVYTTREPGLFAPLAAAFTAKTGIKVNTVFVKDGLAERVAAEGAGSPADVLMTVDVGNLVDLVDKGVTQPLASPALEAAIPANLRGADGQWFALALRARVIYVDKTLTDTPKTYEDLADPKWKGKLCIRNGQHPYNIGLVAAMIAHAGEAKTEAWLKGMKANLARKPGGGDRDVAKDILGGLCSVGVGNSYYVGLMRSGKGGPDQQKWGDAINVVMPTFVGFGTHVNASGGAVARNAPHKEEARQLLEFLVSPEGQKLHAEQDFEYPVVKGASITPLIAALGPLNVDSLSLIDIARQRKAASALIDKVAFDH